MGPNSPQAVVLIIAVPPSRVRNTKRHWLTSWAFVVGPFCGLPSPSYSWGPGYCSVTTRTARFANPGKLSVAMVPSLRSRDCGCEAALRRAGRHLGRWAPGLHVLSGQYQPTVPVLHQPPFIKAEIGNEMPPPRWIRRRARVPRRDAPRGRSQGGALLQHVRPQVLLDEDYAGRARVRLQAGGGGS